MALTQISTDGVKNDAISAGKIPANAVGSSEIADDAVDQGAIADEAVDEARLQISNAGSNGQFLQKQSGNTGGLTWATVDTSIADDAVTQAKIADEAVDEARLQISNAGTNGQFLQKQSGNTGGLTWETINASPSITANADGALAAGDPVYMKTDGTVKKIVQTIINDSTPSSAITSSLVSTGSWDKGNLAVSPEGIGLMVFGDGGVSSNLIARAVKINAGAFTLGTALNIGDSASDIHVEWLITNNNNPVFCVQFYGTSSNSSDSDYNSSTTKYMPLMINASSLAITRGTVASQSGNFTAPSCVRSGTNGQILACQPDSSTCYWRGYQYDNSSATVGNITETQSTITQPGYTGGVSYGGPEYSIFKHSTMLHDPDRDELLMFAYDARGDRSILQYDKAHTVWIDSWNQTTFAQSDISQQSPWNNNHVGQTNRLKGRYIQACYDTTNDRVVVVFTDDDQNDKTFIMAGTNNGKSTGTMSWGTPVEVDSNENVNIHCVFDSVTEKVLICYTDVGDSHKLKWRLCTVDSSDNSVSLGSIYTDTEMEDSQNNVDSDSLGYDPVNRRFLKFFRRTGFSDKAYIMAAKTTSATTTAGGFIGFSNAAVSSGNAANIDIVGSVNENQSSLTVGSKYYLQADGTLGTSADSPSVEAGTAVAATKIIVKG